MSRARREFVAQIRHAGVTLPPALAAAFGSVPREVFVPEGFQRRDGTWMNPADRDFLAHVYRDDVLITKVVDRVPVSSSSQPSLMAIMLDALDVRPGQRVLEIGAGTGYNAALLASLGASVVSVDVQEDVADRARSALARAGIDGVRVVHGDGYAGFPGVRFDRVIVTVGIRGVSPRWLEQLGPDGLVVAPMDHAGFHPVLAVRDGAARVVSSSSFMVASGPLTVGMSPAPGRLVELTEHAGPRFDPLPPAVYRDLWYAAGVWHPRTTHAPVPGHEGTHVMLLDEAGTGGAVLLPDGSVLAGGGQATAYAKDAVELRERWLTAGRPPMEAWRVELGLGGDPEAPIWVPQRWSLPG